MKGQIFKIKTTAYYCCGGVFTFLNFLAFLVSRDHDWIYNPGQAWMSASDTEFRTYPSSEFERTLSCYGLGQCQRIGGALIFQPLIFLGDLISKFYYWNLNAESRIFIIQMVGLGWRILCFTILGLCIYRFSQNIKFVLFFINALFFSLSGWLLRLVGNLVGKLPTISEEFKQRSILAFQDFPHENLKWYDFGLFAVLVIIVLLVIQISEKKVSLVQFFILGLVVTSFFEYLGFVLAVSLAMVRTPLTVAIDFKIKLKQALFIMLGSIMWLGFIASYHRIMQSLWPKFFPGEKERATQHIFDVFWALQHPIENLTSNPSILFQIALVIIQCSLLALLTGFISRIWLKPIQIEPKFVHAMKSVNLAMMVVIFVTTFMAYGVKIQAGEHARQTLGLQISIFMFIFIKAASTKKIVKSI